MSADKASAAKPCEPYIVGAPCTMRSDCTASLHAPGCPRDPQPTQTDIDRGHELAGRHGW